MYIVWQLRLPRTTPVIMLTYAVYQEALSVLQYTTCKPVKWDCLILHNNFDNYLLYFAFFYIINFITLVFSLSDSDWDTYYIRVFFVHFYIFYHI